MTYALLIGFLSFFLDDLKPFLDYYGFWRALPLLALFVTGLVVTLLWIEDLIRGKARAPTSIHNANLPKPTVTVSDWHEALLANDETIELAIQTAKKAEVKGFFGLSNETKELSAEWRRGGWRIDVLSRFDQKIVSIVRPSNKWAGKTMRPRFGLHFRSPPTDALSDAEVTAFTRAFFGLGDEPEGLARVTTVFPRRKSDS